MSGAFWALALGAGALAWNALAAAPIPQRPKTGPVSPGPVGYFAKNCERCHGPEGANYGAEFGKGLSDAALRQIVDDMARGPGRAPLVGAPLDALVAFHRALIAKEPFLVWTATAADSVSGEASSGATVRATAGSKTLPVMRNGSGWTVRLPSGTPAVKVKITASTGKRAVTLDLSQSAWTHSKRVRAPG